MSALVVAREIMGMPDWTPSGEIDHQSTFELPASEDGAPIDVRFARAFAQWIESEGVVVLGGNDNSDGHPLATGGDAMPFGRESSNPYVAKFDDLSGTWTLFNSSNGAKLRMEFEPGEALELKSIEPRAKGIGRAALDALGFGKEVKASESGEPPRMGAPELVDVKITDYCDIGCAYCYQGSTVEGKHAKIEDIRELARSFFAKGVLEVAIGGGEPTRHPQFAESLEAFSAHGIVANFTTRDLSFLKDPELSARIFAASKSVAVSVSSRKQVDEAMSAWESSGWDKKLYSNPLSFQYVIGTGSDAELRQIVERSVKDGLKLTLLGYKDSGRGEQWRVGEGKAFMMREAKVQAQSASWMEMVKDALKERSWAKVSIDTALARECEGALGAGNIPRHLWHKSEGLVSMYVDAVDMTMGVSSYDPKGSMTPFGADWDGTFRSWTPSADESARKKGPSHAR